MNIYNAIMKAADHIDRNPDEFHYSEISVPEHCGSPGCAIGWTAFFSGRTFKKVGMGIHAHHPQRIALVHGICTSLFGVSHDVLYERLEDIELFWRMEAASCARALRRYAEKYHGREKLQEPNFAQRMYLQASGPLAIKETARSEELSW